MGARCSRGGGIPPALARRRRVDPRGFSRGGKPRFSRCDGSLSGQSDLRSIVLAREREETTHGLRSNLEGAPRGGRFLPQTVKGTVDPADPQVFRFEAMIVPGNALYPEVH